MLKRPPKARELLCVEKRTRYSNADVRRCVDVDRQEAPVTRRGQPLDVETLDPCVEECPRPPLMAFTKRICGYAPST